MKDADNRQLTQMLSEREKELDALYQLAVLCSRPIVETDTLFSRTAEILKEAMQYAEFCSVSVTAGDETYASPAFGAEAARHRVSRAFSLEKQITLEVSYHLPPGAAAQELSFVPREQRLIESTAALLAEVLQRRDIDQMLRESTNALQQQTQQLEQKHIALKEVLLQIESDKQHTLSRARQFVSMFIEPCLYKLKESSDLSDQDRSLLLQIEHALGELFSDGAGPMVQLGGMLSPRETELCGLLRGGMTTKQIADLLGITETTVERHRNTIRKKLGLTRRSISLTTYLRSLA